MEVGAVTPEVITSFCQESGIEVVDIQHVQREVFRATVHRDGEVKTEYIKLYPRSMLSAVREVSAIADTIRYPLVDVIADEVLLLFLRETDGYPLSYVLPVALVPGIWMFWGGRIENTYQELGRAFGKLHSETQSQVRALFEHESIEELHKALDGFEEYLTAEHRTSLQQLLEERAMTPVPYAITHGDATPHNLYYTDGDVEMIDLSFKRTPAVKDHASVLMGVDMMVSRTPYARQRIRQELLSSYASGYRRAAGVDPYDEDALLAFTTRYYVALLKRYSGETRTRHGSITRITDVPILERRLTEIADCGKSDDVPSFITELSAANRSP